VCATRSRRKPELSQLSALIGGFKERENRDKDFASIGTLPRTIMLMSDPFVSLTVMRSLGTTGLANFDALGKLWQRICTSQSCTLFASLSKAFVAANFHVSSRPWKSMRFAPAYQFPYSGYGRRSTIFTTTVTGAPILIARLWSLRSKIVTASRESSESYLEL